jgi:cytochrome c oxidase subunit 3
MLGLVVFLVSLGILFASTIVGLLIVGQPMQVWMPENADGLGAGLGVATLILVGISASLHHALARVRRGELERLARDLRSVLVAALLFLGIQSVNWMQVFSASERVPGGPVPHAFVYVLTGLHALHVVGGLVALEVVARRARAGRYTAEEHIAVHHTAIYWHFLLGVWLVTLATLTLAG